MRRAETRCPRCGQLNVRYHGRGSWLLNPEWPSTCSLCGVNLVTGRRSVVDALRGGIVRAAVYLLHAVVGLGIGTVVGGLVWADIVNQPTVVRAAPGALGVTLGLGLAEWSRRKGTLLRARRAASGPPAEG